MRWHRQLTSFLHQLNEAAKPKHFVSGRVFVQCSDLAEVAVADATSELLDLSELLCQTFLLIQLFSESLELSEGQLQRKPVLMPYRCVLQHVLSNTHTTAFVKFSSRS